MHFKINLDNRFKGMRAGDQAHITVDCTDCKIQEPSPFCEVYYSHKFGGPGFKYEVAVSIRGGDIVWVSGPWPAGVTDAVVFQTILSHHLGDNEKAECDNGYKNLEKAVTPGVGLTHLHKKQKSQACGRQENFNGRFKAFNSLAERFRKNDPHKHYLVFNSVAILVQLSQSHGEKMYEVEMNENYH